MRKIPAPRGRVQPLPAGRQGSDGSQAPHLGPGELGHALLHKAFMACAKPCAIGAVQCLLVEFVHPQAADGHGLAGPLAAMALEDLAPGAVGQVEPLHQRWRQGGRGQQHARAQQARPVH